jgi:putative flippase GtrA
VSQLVSFGLIGLLGTGTYLTLFLLLRPGLHAQGANALARLLTAVPVGWLNTRLTFRSVAGPVRIVVGGLASLAAGILLSGAVLLSAHALISSRSPSMDVAALLFATVVATIGRFVVLRGFATSRQNAGAQGGTRTIVQSRA